MTNYLTLKDVIEVLARYNVIHRTFPPVDGPCVTYGMTVFSNKLILINKQRPPGEVMDTITHELLHAHRDLKCIDSKCAGEEEKEVKKQTKHIMGCLYGKR